MNNNDSDLTSLQSWVSDHLKAWRIFDLPVGRHVEIANQFYSIQGNSDEDTLDAKLQYIVSHLKEFNKFLEDQPQYKSNRLDVERQATLEPRRLAHAVDTLTEMGIDVCVINQTEINFTFKGETVKYFPYSGWASGKSITDGRGFRRLVRQLK